MIFIKKVPMTAIPKKIFIVDDDEMMAEALSDYLTRKVQHSVQIFNTGEDCLLHMDVHPDVIILDYFLNSMDKNAANGLQILEELRKKKTTAKIIMLSSQERYGVMLQSIQKGAETYLMKGHDSFEKINDIVNDN
jgi:two-component system OmpR family response regulator